MFLYSVVNVCLVYLLHIKIKQRLYLCFQPSRPFILTKNDLQKKVFGMGYPSTPTYTVEEFYEAQVRAGQIPPPGAGG